MKGSVPSIQRQRPDGAISRRVAIASLAAGAALAGVGRHRALAQATPAPREQGGAAPNHFALSGAEWEVTCDLDGAVGPRLTVDGPYGRQSLTGDALRVEQSALGQLVTGDLGAFPDQGELRLTLLLPAFNPMSSDDAPAPFATLAILTWVISTIAGPPRTGALEEYRVVALQGTAQLVMT